MNTRWESMLRDCKMNNSQIIAMRELKFPMLKHSLATSMKNSITWALCFFFAGCSSETKHKTKPPPKYFFLNSDLIFHREFISTYTDTGRNFVCASAVTQNVH